MICVGSNKGCVYFLGQMRKQQMDLSDIKSRMGLTNIIKGKKINLPLIQKFKFKTSININNKIQSRKENNVGLGSNFHFSIVD